MKPTGGLVCACDTVQAGPGALIYYVKGREASMALPQKFNPADATIIGIVDDVDVRTGRS